MDELSKTPKKGTSFNRTCHPTSHFQGGMVFFVLGGVDFFDMFEIVLFKTSYNILEIIFDKHC